METVELPDRIRRAIPSQTFPDFPSSTTARAKRLAEERARGQVTLAVDESGRFIWTEGHLVISWIEANCVLTAADYIGRPFKLLPWQKQLLLELFEVIPTDDPRFPSGWKRKHRWALIGLPKKNGKTELAAALGLYFLIADDEGAPVICCAAASEEQANLVFGAARRMCELSPTLSQITDCQTKTITVRNKPGAELIRVAAAAGTNDGKNIHANLLDELHEWPRGKGDDVFNVLTNGTGARKQPMNIMITTAGHDEDTVCYEMYEYGIKVREGIVDDPWFYFYWIEPLDERGAPLGTDAPHDDLSLVPKVNPSFGLILHEDFYIDQLIKKPESTYRRYFLNQWTEAEEIWEAAQIWDQLAGDPLWDETLPLFVAIDVGRRHDSSAIVTAQWLSDDKCHVHQWLWENPYRRHTREYDEYRINTAELENVLRDLRARFPAAAALDEDDFSIDGPAFFYDPHFFHRSAEDLQHEGLNMVEEPQTDMRMMPASQRLFEVIKRHELIHDGSLAARRHIRSVVPKERERGWRIHKEPGTVKRIDFAVALAIAVRHATDWRNRQEDMPSVW